MEGMTQRTKKYKSLVSGKGKRFSFLVIIIIVLIVVCLIGKSANKGNVESRLYGYWNMVPDSLVMKGSTKNEFVSIVFNFSNQSVELPLLRTPNVNLQGKTLLDADINEDSLNKDWCYYQKSIKEAIGTWKLYSSKDSIEIHALSHPFNGKYRLDFFKRRFLGQEHYYMRMSNDSIYVVCEKFFSGYVNKELLQNWGNL